MVDVCISLCKQCNSNSQAGFPLVSILNYSLECFYVEMQLSSSMMLFSNWTNFAVTKINEYTCNIKLINALARMGFRKSGYFYFEVLLERSVKRHIVWLKFVLHVRQNWKKYHIILWSIFHRNVGFSRDPVAVSRHYPDGDPSRNHII